ncbi:ribosomal RNA small subunit methyltransferase A [Candidatus Bathyarchaeota archaeon]|nr:ribosomal RNA small subunit methyltransferase A [Candidatus Bathyarchaeota archaeon]
MGQNFTVDASVFGRVVDYALLSGCDVVLEVGAGLGFLTRLLAKKCKRVLAVERDRRLVEVLRGQLADVSNVVVVEGDVFRVQVSGFNKVVSVPPYQVSSRLVSWLFERGFECAVMVFQEEFAERLVASVGAESYGWLAVVAYYYADVGVLDRVSRSAFFPQPEVDSVIVRLRSRKPMFAVSDEKLFVGFVRSVFVDRNRKVRNAVLPFLKGVLRLGADDACRVAGGLPFRDRRVRELAPEDFGVLVNAVVG